MKTTERLVAVICALLICVTVFTTVASAATPPSLPELRKWQGTWTQVNVLQRMLNYANSAGLSTDGSFGPATENAVKAFQAKKGLKKDGIVGDNTWKALFRDCQLKYRAGNLMRGDLVRLLQTMLNSVCYNKAGYTRIVVDGVFGEGTKNAVKFFQDNVMKTWLVDGIVGQDTWTWLVGLYCG